MSHKSLNVDELMNELLETVSFSAPEPRHLGVFYPETPIHKVADTYVALLQRTTLKAFANGRAALGDNDIEAAVTAVHDTLLKLLPNQLYQIAQAAHGTATRRLRAAARKRFGPIEMDIEDDNPNDRAARWARKHAGRLAKDISETTRERIAEAIAKAQESGDLRRQYREILKAVGDEDRASTIARTESMRAANEGQREAWREAEEDGVLVGVRRVWIATEIAACEICESLDGKKADLDGEYPGEGGDGPPQHPNCRCTEGITGS